MAKPKTVYVKSRINDVTETTDEILELPVMNFGSQDQVNGAVENADDDLLDVPVMNFDPPKRSGATDIG